MRACYAFLLLLFSQNILAQACIIESVNEQVEVKICQQNNNIPEQLSKTGFCQPQLKGQKPTVTFVDDCPSGSFGICRSAQSVGVPYQQDIYYYGVATDALYLKPACEQQSQGTWVTEEQ